MKDEGIFNMTIPLSMNILNPFLNAGLIQNDSSTMKNYFSKIKKNKAENNKPDLSSFKVNSSNPHLNPRKRSVNQDLQMMSSPQHTNIRIFRKDDKKYGVVIPT